MNNQNFRYNNGNNNNTQQSQQQFFMTSRGGMQPAVNRIPSSPHSDSAATIHSNSHSAGQTQHRRPLSVPLQNSASAMMDHSYQRDSLQQYHQGSLSQQPAPSQHTIAEEMEEVMEEDEPSQHHHQGTKDEPEGTGLATGHNPESTALGTDERNGSYGVGEMMQTGSTASKAENSPAISIQQHSVNPASSVCSVDHPSVESQSPSKAPYSLDRRSEDEQVSSVEAPRPHHHQHHPQQQQQPQNSSNVQDHEEQQHAAEFHRQQRRAPVVLDCRSFERAMLTSTTDGQSPLERFLFGQTLLARLYPFFELAEKESRERDNVNRGKLSLPIRELQWTQGVLAVRFPSYTLPLATSIQSETGASSQQFHLCQIRFQLSICPEKFRLIGKLEYSGPNCPAEADVHIFEQFFVTQVCPMNNEMAVFAFITLCRISSPPIFSSLAQLMLAQMEPQSYPWRIELELLHLTDQQQPPTQNDGQKVLPPGQQPHFQKAVQISIQVTSNSTQFLMPLYLCPNKPNANGPRRGAQMAASQSARHIFRYSIERNELALHTLPNQQQPSETEQIANILRAKTELINSNKYHHQQQQPQSSSQGCCIWPCIQALLEGQHFNA